MKMTIKYLFYSLAMVLAFTFVACSSDDDDNASGPGGNFDYPVEKVCGTWKVKYLYDDMMWPLEPTSITFRADGSYSGCGAFGNGSGTWKGVGKQIITYVSGKEYIRYTILKINSTYDTAKIEMSEPGSSETITVTCVKQ